MRISQFIEIVVDIIVESSSPEDAAVQIAQRLRGQISFDPEKTMTSMMLLSLKYEDPYKVIDPEVRASFPLTDEMVDQNRRLLEREVDLINAIAHRPVKVPHG